MFNRITRFLALISLVLLSLYIFAAPHTFTGTVTDNKQLDVHTGQRVQVTGKVTGTKIVADDHGGNEVNIRRHFACLLRKVGRVTVGRDPNHGAGVTEWLT